MNFNNPEEITKYVNLATNVLMGVDDVIRAFKDKPRRPGFQQYMDERMGVTRRTMPGSLEELLKQAGYGPEPEVDEEGKTPQEKVEEEMIGTAVQDDEGLDLDLIDAYMGAAGYEIPETAVPIQRESFFRKKVRQ